MQKHAPVQRRSLIGIAIFICAISSLVGCGKEPTAPVGELLQADSSAYEKIVDEIVIPNLDQMAAICEQVAHEHPGAPPSQRQAAVWEKLRQLKSEATANRTEMIGPLTNEEFWLLFRAPEWYAVATAMAASQAKSEAKKQWPGVEIDTKTDAFRHAYWNVLLSKRIELVAQSRSTVLITGETGTGKELVARAIHDRSQQRHLPLIKVNCAAIPETLIESELFGHVRGAFTGATSAKKGRFALADGGTIFLDEIATLGAAVQSKLLRVLQEREFEPLGSERTEKVDVRVIAATNRDLRSLVAEGRFQEDLFYRLNVIPIDLPPLRQRLDDLPALVDHFLRRFAQRLGKRITGIEDAALVEFKRYHWPGNVRELENTIERAVVLATGPRLTLDTVWLMGATAAPTAGLPSLRLHQNIEWVERETIRHALTQARGVKKDAAELMGLSQRALSHYLSKHRID